MALLGAHHIFHVSGLRVKELLLDLQTLLFINKHLATCMISGLRSGVHGICALLRLYTAQIGSLIPIFRGNLAVPLTTGMVGCLEPPVTNCQSALRKVPEECRSPNLLP